VEEASKLYIATSLLDIRNEELQKAYDELDKFAYSVSHDLRDPLTGILSALQLASSLDSLTEIRELLGLMEGSVTMLDDYINSLRDYYLLRRGELNLSAVDFNELFANIQQFYKIHTQNSRLQFNVSVQQEEAFQGDKAVLELILHNLLSNAFKYQQKYIAVNQVNLAVEVREGHSCITVKDNGIGISPKNIDNIFKLFFRDSDQAEGMGFGLYNVQSALSKVQGTIKVESELGIGTCFRVTIPSK